MESDRPVAPIVPVVLGAARRLRVLVVEDDSNVRLLVHHVLSEAQIDADVAPSARIALSLLYDPARAY